VIICIDNGYCVSYFRTWHAQGDSLLCICLKVYNMY